MKLGDLKNAETPLMFLVSKELPIRIAFQLNSVIDGIDENLKRLEDFRVKLVEKYGDTDKVTGEITVRKENIGKFQQEYDELLDSEIDLTPVEIPMSVFEENNINMSVKNVNSLVKAGFIKVD